MQYISFINISSASENGIKALATTLMKIELFLIVLSFLGMLFAIYILFATTQYHKNLSWIFANFSAQYAVSLIANTYLKTSQLIYGGENLIGSTLFEFAIFVRILCTLTCLVVYTGVIFERVLAMIFVKDYETKNLVKLPILAIVLNLINIIDFLITLIAYKCSEKRIYDNSVVLEGVLSWRYQQEENFRSWKLLRVLLSVIIFFNIAMGCCLMIPVYFGDDPHIDNIASLSLDAVIILFVKGPLHPWHYRYGLVAPMVALYFNKLWQKELFRLMTLAGMGGFAKWINSKSISPLARSISFNGQARQQDTYFNQLSNDWNNAHIKKSSSR